MTLVIKGADEKIIREFKAEAVRRGLTLSKAFEKAVLTWLTLKDKEVLSEADLNNLVYETLRDKLKEHTGKYAVIARGKLVGIFETVEEVAEALKKFQPPVKHAIVLKIGYDDRVSEGLEWLGGSIELVNA